MGGQYMNGQKFTEQEPLKDLDAITAHAGEPAQLLPQEVDPLERLSSSVIRYDRPFDGCWDDALDPEEDERCSDDVPLDREQPSSEQ